MEIKMGKRKSVNWTSIECGQCFIFNNELFMKIWEVDCYNSVCLNDGTLEFFSDDECVEVVSAYMVVE